MSPSMRLDPMIGSESAPFAFLSSLTAGHERLRSAIFDLGQEHGRYVWVSERCRPDLGGCVDKLEIADVLIDRVRASRHYVVILGGERHGTPIPLGEHPSSASYFEIELFAAALSGKPIHVFTREGFSPGPRMRALLQILAWSLPATGWRQPMSDADIVAALGELLVFAGPAADDPGGRRNVLARLIRQFYVTRGRGGELCFLDHQFESRASGPDLDLVDTLLVKVREISDQERKLARLWLAVRELMARPFAASRDERLLRQWDSVLGLWGSAAAWYGLHGHLYLGGRAALGTMVQVRHRLREISPSGRDMFAHPSTALASATYSIAKLAPWREGRALLHEALGHLEHPDRARGLRADANAMALRGSILLRLGHPWRAATAYRQALRWRLRGEEPAKVGESMSELGYCCLFTGNVGEGLALLRSGSALLDQHGGAGFRARAKRKLAHGLAATGRFAEARAVQHDAAALASQDRMFDQLK
ncbi:MAG: hypothetical protein KF715_19810 [Candidatus Didemnitutus sp.]|nr:hypothetical protein [Candidatus Didemnitutus sp.]